MPYHTKGITKNKKIREQRNKPLPLMKFNPEDIKEPSELKRLESQRRGISENPFHSEIV